MDGLTGFCGFFFFLGVMAFFYGLSDFRNALRATSWSSTPCTIVQSVVKQESRLQEGSSFKVFIPDIVFEYKVCGRTHVGTRFQTLWTKSFPTEEKCQECVNDYPVGMISKCFVNPSDSEESVLDNTFLFDYVMPLIMGIIFAGGSSIFYFEIYPWLQAL